MRLTATQIKTLRMIEAHQEAQHQARAHSYDAVHGIHGAPSAYQIGRCLGAGVCRDSRTLWRLLRLGLLKAHTVPSRQIGDGQVWYTLTHLGMDHLASL